MYKRLSIIEIVYCEDGTILASDAERIILEQLNNLRKQIYCISIVCVGEQIDNSRLLNFIKQIKTMNLPISITCVNCYDYSFLNSIKEYVIQIRINLNNDKVEEPLLKKIYNELKIERNNIIFLLDLLDTETAIYYLQLLDKNNFIFTITYNHLIEPQVYWGIVRCVSAAKEVHPSNIYVDFTCGGVAYKNIRGICPARNILMCIDASGHIKYCYKDKVNHGLSIEDGDLNELFYSLSNAISTCKKILCDGGQYRQCIGGCPLDISNGINKFCFYKTC